MKEVFYQIAGVLNVSVHTEEMDNVSDFIEKHYHYFKIDTADTFIGQIRLNKSLFIPKSVIELKKNMLYEEGSFLYIKAGRGCLKFTATEEEFFLEYHPDSDLEISFFTLEMLIRMYAPKFNLVFTHSSGYIMDGKLTVINAFGGVGKTEVMMLACQRGAKFIADDFAIMNSKGQIFPYPKMIYLCEYPYDNELLKMTHKSKFLWKVNNFVKNHKDPVSVRLASRLECQYFGIKIDYNVVCKEETELKFYDIDNFYWVDSSNNTEFKNFIPEIYIQKMSLCLDIESRRYFDYDGYIRLKFPFFNGYKIRQTEILSQISKNVNVRGVNIMGRKFRDLANLLFENN